MFLFWRQRKPLAGLVVVRYVACPYCGAVYRLLTLGLYVGRVETSRERRDKFRETHIANPVECPNCGNRYIVFVGVEYNSHQKTVVDVHVDIAVLEEDVGGLVNWPYRGVVHGGVLEYDGVNVYRYDSWEQFLAYNGAEDLVEPGSEEEGVRLVRSLAGVG